MHRLTPYVTRSLAILLLLAATAPDAPTETTAAKCCFTNPHYAGTCEVQPAKDESCSSILGYLNSPMSQGKSYCGSTTVRGGWQSVACESKP